LFLRVHVLKGRRRQIDALHSTKMRDSGNFFNSVLWNLKKKTNFFFVFWIVLNILTSKILF
jgi:hypothetical protein